MINISAFTDTSGKYIGFEVKGHAGYDEYGQDIICSAISVLTINLVNSVEQLTEQKFSLEEYENEGRLCFHIKGELLYETSLLMNSYMLGIRSVLEEYGNQYIRINIREVK